MRHSWRLTARKIQETCGDRESGRNGGINGPKTVFRRIAPFCRDFRRDKPIFAKNPIFGPIFDRKNSEREIAEKTLKTADLRLGGRLSGQNWAEKGPKTGSRGAPPPGR